MTIQEFEKALRSGQGRAAFCLTQNDPAPYLPALLKACLDGRNYEQRADYLFNLITFAQAQSVLENEVLTALPTLREERDLKVAWDLLNRLAKADHERSRAAVMAEALRTKDGARLIASWGFEGLRFLLDRRPDLFAGEYDSFLDSLIQTAIDNWSEETIEEMLPSAIRKARSTFQHEPSSYRLPDATGLTYDHFLVRYEQESERFKGTLVYAFGEVAAPAEHRRLAEAVLAERDHLSLRTMKYAFLPQPWPLDAGLLIDRIDDPAVGDDCIEILAKVQDPRLHNLAFGRLERPVPDWRILPLLESNVSDVDLSRLFDLAHRLDLGNFDEVHKFVLPLSAFAKRVTPGLVPIMEWAAENVPCSSCRRDIILGLAQQGLLSDPIRREIGFDEEFELHRYANDLLHPLLPLERFRVAVSWGLGRAAICLMSVDPTPYRPILIDACLYDRSFHMSESNRTPYLVQLAVLAQAEEAVVDALLRELPNTEDERNDLPQRLDLFAAFAQRGHVRARLALLGRALQQDQAVSALAANGVSALQWLIDVRPELFTPERFEDSWYWVYRAEDASGKEAVDAILPMAYKDARRKWEDRPRPPEPAPITDPEELLRRFAEKASRSPRSEALRFGLAASEEALRIFAGHMLAETDLKTVWAMAGAFRVAPWPLEITPLFERIDGDDRASRTWRQVLIHSESPDLRAFARQRLEMNPPDQDAVGFLAPSFQPGDEDRILEALLRVDPYEESLIHSLIVDLRKLAESVGLERFVPHLQWALEHNPCSFCRIWTIEYLLKVGALSEAHRREAHYDAEPETRSLVL